MVMLVTDHDMKENDDNNDNEGILKHPDILANNPLNNMQLMFEPSQLVPIINDRCESLKLIFRSMRDILNNLRPHQAKQVIITVLQQQLLYKQNKLKSLKQNIMKGEKIINEQLNMNKEEENESDHEMICYFHQQIIILRKYKTTKTNFDESFLTIRLIDNFVQQNDPNIVQVSLVIVTKIASIIYR